MSSLLWVNMKEWKTEKSQERDGSLRQQNKSWFLLFKGIVPLQQIVLGQTILLCANIMKIASTFSDLWYELIVVGFFVLFCFKSVLLKKIAISKTNYVSIWNIH